MNYYIGTSQVPPSNVVNVRVAVSMYGLPCQCTGCRVNPELKPDITLTKVVRETKF